jgi:RNA polymerase sigma-70 factor (ECF subfamily)
VNARRVAEGPEFAGCAASFEAELDYVLRTLRRHGVRSSDAEDLAQDVFLVMWRRWADFDPTRPLRSWLAGIAFRVAHEHHKRSRRFWPREGLDPLDERPLPDEQVASASERRLVLGALARLPERQRSILVMHDLDELPMPEIAAMLKVPLFTGYSRLRMARQAFARSVKRLRANGPGLDAPVQDLLAAERTPPPISAPVRRRVVSRARAWLAAPIPPRPRPMPVTRPWSVAAALAVGLVALLPGGKGAGLRAPVLAAGSPGLARGLIGYWRFDESAGATAARDLSPRHNDCLLRPSGARLSSTAGAVGGALVLDGKSWLECSRPELVAALDREISISVWVKPAAIGGRQAFVARQLGTGAEDYFLLGLLGPKLEVQSDLWQSATHRLLAQPTGQWLHVVAVQNRGGQRWLYLDGALIGYSTASRRVSLGGGTTPLTIGGAINGPDPAAADDRFKGALDELAIYDRALSADEVRALAARTQPAI